MDWALSRFTRNVVVDAGTLAMSSDAQGSMFVGYRSKLAGNELRLGFLSQRGQWADVQMNGMYGEVSGSSGYSVGLARNVPVTDNGTLNFGGDYMTLQGHMQRTGIVTGIDSLKMVSATASYRHNIGSWGYAGVRVNAVRTLGGGLNMTTPSGVNYDEASDTLSVQYTDTKMAIQNGLPVASAWAEITKTQGNFNYSLYGGVQRQQEANNVAVGVNMRYTFN